ncbi:hypothetical protein N8642_02590 [bacterium]|jgi:hypothetical protein|nr:hypothetical protein [bacterium]
MPKSKEWSRAGEAKEQPTVVTIDRDEAKRMSGANRVSKSKRKATSVYLNERELTEVAKAAEKVGESISDFIRQTLRKRLRI